MLLDVFKLHGDGNPPSIAYTIWLQEAGDLNQTLVAKTVRLENALLVLLGETARQLAMSLPGEHARSALSLKPAQNAVGVCCCTAIV